jgi:hypothetical protein
MEMVVRKKTVAVKKVARVATKKPKVAPPVAAPASEPRPEFELTASPATPAKQKLVRDSFTMPKLEYDAIATLKVRLVRLARPTKKGELIRAGIGALASMSDAELRTAVERIPSLKTGRPKKAKNDPVKLSRKKSGG